MTSPRSSSRSLYINETVVSMPLMEYRLLLELKKARATRKPGLLGRGELERLLWPDEEGPNGNRLDVTLHNLRKRLPPRSIINKFGVGWVLSKRVRVVSGE